MPETTETPATPEVALNVAAAIYQGTGDYFGGIPARHLTAGEWAELTPGQQENCLTSGLYRLAPGTKTHPGIVTEPAAPAPEPAPEPEPAR